MRFYLFIIFKSENLICLILGRRSESGHRYRHFMPNDGYSGDRRRITLRDPDDSALFGSPQLQVQSEVDAGYGEEGQSRQDGCTDIP
jgi:hypothetical protein